MNKPTKLSVLLLLMLCSFSSFCQENENTKIECKAKKLIYDAKIEKDVHMLVDQVVFTHEGAIGYCDTAYFNEKRNTITARGENLVIHVNDSVSLYGNFLIYDGETRTAFITKDTVVLTNESATLYTDTLIYNRNTGIAYYHTYGRLVSGNSTLKSQQGWYHTKTNDVYFKNDVVLTSPQYTIETDTLRYNTTTEIAYFLGPTTIHNDSNFMVCEYGWYNTYSDVCQFEKNARMYNNTQFLAADTIWYDREHDMGIAHGHVSIEDSTANIVLYSNYAEYQKEKNYAYLTDSAVAVLIQKDDSLFLHSNEIRAIFDTTQQLQYLFAFYGVRFYRDDLQGVCDSISYDATDSVVYMINFPILWSEGSQMKADTVKIFLKNGQIHQMHFINNSSVNQDVFQEEKFNQIRGTNMIVDFYNNNISTVFVDANAECLYYVQEDNKDLIGIQKSVSAQMRIFFENNEISKIRLYKQIKGEMYPLDKLPLDRLSGFIWLNQYRPTDKQDIFREDYYNANE